MRDALSLDTTLTSLLLDDLASGRLPFVRTAVIHPAPALEDLVPDGAAIVRRVESDASREWLCEGDGYRARINRSLIGVVNVDVYAEAVELAERILEDVRGRCPEPPPADDVPISIWSGSGSRIRRRLACPPWSVVSRNYPGPVRDALSALAAMRPGDDGGRVVLLHGEPGTGKTTAIRSLLWEWRSWARAEVISNGEALLRDPAYFNEIATAHRVEEWQVLVLEDAGELVDHDLFCGGDLSRLLNLTDGIVGAGSKTLFLLTTNERIGEPHRALTRPGRCLANIEFTRFSRREAVEWLGGQSTGVRPEGMTLAELYDHTSTASMIVTSTEAAPSRLYL
jgi:hypothetical protein